MTAVAKKEDGTVQFTVIIPKDEVRKEYDETLDKAVAVTEISGFRKGKAPKDRVEAHLGKQKLFTQTLQRILPGAYAQKAKELKLKPISHPKIEPKKIEEGSDWELFITVAEKPKIILGDYKKAVAGAKKASNIWVPGKDDPTKKTQEGNQGQTPEESTDKQIAKVLDTLLDTVKFEIAGFLIEEEQNRLLSQLIQKIERLGMSLDQYLISINKTSEKLREEYKTQAERNVKLELILNEIANDMNVTVSNTEIDKLIKAVGDEKLRENLNKPEERASIAASLRKRKVLDSLMKM